MRSGALVLVVAVLAVATAPRAVAADGEAPPSTAGTGWPSRASRSPRPRARSSSRRAGMPWTPRAPCSPPPARCGTRSAGAGGAQALVYDPRHEEGDRHQRPRRSADGCDTRTSSRRGGFAYPPEFGPLAAVTPGTPGGLITMLAEYGRLSLKDVLEPAIQMADGYPIEAQLANRARAGEEATLPAGRTRRRSSCPTRVEAREAPVAGEVFVQADLATTLRQLVDAERQALAAGKSRQRGSPGRLRPLLPGGHRPGARPRHAGSRAGSSRPTTLPAGR